ncbi:MAG: outer membrane beta-barrel protein [Ferruginibacter sp.]
MKKITLLIILLIAFYCFSSAQKASVKGVIFDSINELNLTNTSVSLLQQKDSTLYKLTHSDEKGNFELKNLLAGNYLLFVTHPTYTDYIDHLQLNDSSHIDIGTVMMIIKAKILKEVIVRHHISAIKINGDTTDFIADSFTVREGASVEEMLKKLPGVQVDKNGIITAMGEKVNRILVDGEEFFGDDPTIATKNLQADAVYKVQVFDKKSDQATFTGIDDGERSKTINLKLKVDKKKGYFGKLDLGASLNDMWANSAMINSFRDKRKLSAYGIMSSTDKTGSDLQATNQYISGNGPEFNDNFGGFVGAGNNDGAFNNFYYSGEGLPESWAGGLNYSNKFHQNKQSMNGSYLYNKFNSKGYGSTLSQSILPDTVFFNSESSKTFSSRQRHSLNGTYEWQIDSSTSIKMKANGYKGIGNSINSFTSESQNEIGNPVNNNVRNTSVNGDNQNLQSSFLLRKKFKKPGRTISFNLEQKYNENNSYGFLYSLNSFFDKSGGISLRDTTDQKKVNERVVATLNGKIIYTEPLSKNLFVELNYALHNSRSDAQLLSFDKNLSGKYEFINDTFSNHYNFNVFTNIAGVAFKYNGTKATFSLGSNIAKANFNQKDLLKELLFERNFTNFFPRAGFTYKLNQSSRLSINYNGNTRQPSINQIQPVQNNSNPLSIIIGNPLLEQEFDHSFDFNFNAFNVLNERGVFFYGSFSLQSNAIVTNNFTDTLGRTVNQYINTNGNDNYSSGVTYFLRLKKPDVNVNMGFDLNGSRYNNVVNNQKNIATNTAVAFNLSFSKDKEKKYNFYYYGSIFYNISKSSIRKDLETKYWTQEHNLDLTLVLPWKLELNNELQGSLRQKTGLFDHNNNVLLWNAYFGKKFRKNDKAIIKIIVHDILNQNTGYSRFISSNLIQETNYQNIARYFLLSFVWNFSKSSATH